MACCGPCQVGTLGDPYESRQQLSCDEPRCYTIGHASPPVAVNNSSPCSVGTLKPAAPVLSLMRRTLSVQTAPLNLDFLGLCRFFILARPLGALFLQSSRSHACSLLFALSPCSPG